MGMVKDSGAVDVGRVATGPSLCRLLAQGSVRRSMARHELIPSPDVTTGDQCRMRHHAPGRRLPSPSVDSEHDGNLHRFLRFSAARFQLNGQLMRVAAI